MLNLNSSQATQEPWRDVAIVNDAVRSEVITNCDIEILKVLSKLIVENWIREYGVILLKMKCVHVSIYSPHP